MELGFIGLGNMGRRIVDHQLAAGHSMTLWARRDQSLEPYADGPARIGPDPASVGAAADLVGICVWDAHDVDEVLLGERGVLAGLRPGAVVAIHSTISPAACERLADATAARGGHLLDAPVSVGSSAPKLLVMVGGEAAVVERCRPALEAFGDPVLHLGTLGSGQVAKLVNNTLLAAQVGIGENAVALGTELGLDRAALAAALGAGSARGTWNSFVADDPPSRDAATGRTMEWARKDVGLTRALAHDRGIGADRPILAMAAFGTERIR